MASHVEQQIAARIARVRAEEERKRQERAELAAVRAAGLATRHATKLRRHTPEGDVQVKTYRRHNCQTRHSSWADLAACIWPAARIEGDGPYAVLGCAYSTVALYAAPDQAHTRRRSHDRDGCGPGCRRRHQLIALDPADPQTTQETPMPAALRPVHCPSCRRERPARLAGTVTVNGAKFDVLRCLDAACSLLWLVRAERPRTASAAAA